jgi:PAS domain S-box-containing protein
MLGCTFLLPRVACWHVFSNIVLPVMLVYPVVAALLGKLMADHLKRDRTNCRLQESEERYQNLARISPVGIFRADMTGATTYVNPMWCRIAGLTEAQAMGFGWLAAVHPDDRDTLSQGWQETIRLRKPSFADYRFQRQDGTVIWVMGQAAPEMNPQGQIVGYVGTITDISERKRAEELNRAQLAEKEVLLKEVHHRVKNNLMTIIGLVKMQESKVPDGSMAGLLRELEGRVRSMAIVHENLYKSTDLTRVDLQDYIEMLSAHIRALFGSERPIRFSVQAVGAEVDLDTAIPCGLILNELITNAFQHAFRGDRPHCGQGQCEVVVTVKREGGELILTVSDNGVGLPETLDWEKAETLGLKLIKMLSRQINGSIEVDRARGTAFRLKFAPSSAGS